MRNPVSWLIVLVSFLPFASCMRSPLNDDGVLPVYINTDFDSGNINGWSKNYVVEGYSFQYSTVSPRSGTACAQFNLRPDDIMHANEIVSSTRTEIAIDGVAPWRGDVYYGWSFKIDSAYIDSDEWQVVGQFHDKPDFAAGESWEFYPPNSPPVSYTLQNGEIALSMSTPGNRVIKVARRAVAKGVWLDIVTHVYWSEGIDGFVEAWINDVPLTPYNGKDYKYYRPNLFNRSGNYLKIGLYRSKEIKTTNTVYFDSVRSGKTYAEVRP